MSEHWLILALSIACAGLTLACAIAWWSRHRFSSSVSRLNAQIFEAAETAAFGERVALRGRAQPEVVRLSATINRLFDALNARDRQVRQRELLFQDLANGMPEPIIVHRERIIFANKVAADLLGVTEEQLVGRPATDLVRPAYRAMLRKQIAGRLTGESVPDRYEMQLISGDEGGLWVEANSSQINYRGQNSILTVARDISYRKSVEASLGRGKQQAQITLESIGEAVVTTDVQGTIDYLNAAAERLLGIARDAALGKRLSDLVLLVDEADHRDLGDPVGRCLKEGRRVSLGRRALMMVREGGRELSVELTASPITGPADKPSGAVVIMHDVTELRGLTQRMSYEATHDALTGLINRGEFERRLEQALKGARDENVRHVLCYLDLDRFKAVNDTCGHLAGDNLLRELAGVIRSQVRDSDFVGRIGGDEFGVLLIGCPLEKARQIADDVCRAVRDYRFVWQDRIFTVGISVGLVEVSSDSASIEDLLSAADSACYIAKQQGRGRVHVYSARDEVTARQRGDIHWLRQLQAALREGRFQLHVQPILGITTDAAGPAVEVFLRLTDDEGRLVMPRNFLKAAERYQLMPAIDRWVVQATLTAISQGAIRLADERSCTINLSSQSLAEPAFLEFLVDCLDHLQVPPEKISFETSEGAVMGGLEHARRFIAVLQDLGCGFGLDDFGSGFGSFASLRELSIDYLKIDGAYTHDLRADSLNHQVVSAITRLAKTVGFRVIAEQVEEQGDFEALREVGVDFVQGYFVERPHRLGEASRALSVS